MVARPQLALGALLDTVILVPIVWPPGSCARRSANEIRLSPRLSSTASLRQDDLRSCDSKPYAHVLRCNKSWWAPCQGGSVMLLSAAGVSSPPPGWRRSCSWCCSRRFKLWLRVTPAQHETRAWPGRSSPGMIRASPGRMRWRHRTGWSGPEPRLIPPGKPFAPPPQTGAASSRNNRVRDNLAMPARRC